MPGKMSPFAFVRASPRHHPVSLLFVALRLCGPRPHIVKVQRAGTKSHNIKTRLQARLRCYVLLSAVSGKVYVPGVLQFIGRPHHYLKVCVFRSSPASS